MSSERRSICTWCGRKVKNTQVSWELHFAANKVCLEQQKAQSKKQP